MELQNIYKSLAPDEYVCEYCKQKGDVNTMVSINGLFHVKCYKIKKQTK